MTHVTLHVHFGRLSQDQPDLARAVRNVIGYHGNAWRVTELDEFTDRELAERLRRWVGDRQRFVPDPQATPEPPPPTPPTQPLPPQIDMNALIQEQERDMQARADEQAGKDRLDEYVEKQRLEASDHNLNIILNWLKENAGNYLSVANIDRCIAACRGSLQFTPAAPVEVLTKLKDGTTQLPLEADEGTLKRASLAQLYDIQRRRREVSKQQFRDNSARYVGSFGSKF
jgi:hypothetical protein